MGRKPNPLVVEYFSRGPKLPDSSNRYQHTCRNCHERFPKGRLDSLLTHLKKQCPALSSEEQTRIIHRLYKIADKIYPHPSDRPENKRRGVARTLPPQQPSFDGLTVLAEASRRVGATDGKRPSEYISHDENELVLDPALEVDPTSFAEATHQPYQFLSRPSQVPDSSPSPRLTQLPLAPTDSLSVSQETVDLSSIAAYASDMVTSSLLPIDPNISMPRALDPQADSRTLNTETEDDLSKFSDPVQRAVHFPRPIAAAHPDMSKPDVGESTIPGQSEPPKKTRARFAPDRRREVSDVRRLGACLRCRVLRKPCSGESPCKTCSVITNARTWTWPCSRDRIGNELQLFSEKPFWKMAHRAIVDSHEDVGLRDAQGCMEIMLHGIDGMAAYITQLKTGLEAEVAASRTEQESESRSRLVIINQEIENLDQQIVGYMKQTFPNIISAEPVSALRSTLERALAFITNQNDSLVLQVLELWATTTILTSADRKWNVNTTLQPSTTTNPTTFLVDETEHPESYKLITQQLLRSLEKHADHLSNAVANELEHRLLRKVQGGVLSLLLAVIILLNCVERMSWLFHAWSEIPSLGDWPLDQLPEVFIRQGERFCDIVTMLLRVRNLVPRLTVVDDQGTLRVAAGTDEGIETWLNGLGLTVGFLKDRQVARIGARDLRSADWRLVGRMLGTGDGR